MLTIDALNILGLNVSNATKEKVKEAYRKACKEYHPDVNKAGEQMMKMVNEAYESLENYTFSPDNFDEDDYDQNTKSYGDEINEVLNKIINLEDIKIEVCGSWVWVTGETKPVKDILKEAGFRWAPYKKAWVYSPKTEVKRRKRPAMPMDQIRSKYGSDTVETKGTKKIAA